MIQAVNQVNNAYSKGKNTSFGDSLLAKTAAQPAQVSNQPAQSHNQPASVNKSKAVSAGKFLGYLGFMFGSGALANGVFEGLTNLYRTIKKNKELTSVKDIAKNSLIMGCGFVVIALVSAFIQNRKDKKKA